MEIKKVKKSELQTINDLENEIFSDSWNIVSLEDSLKKENSLFLCCKHEDTILGYIIVYFAADEGEIIRIAVKKEYRRKGLGEHLLLAVEDYCEQNKIDKLFLEVREGNHEAMSFYEENGFENVGIRKDYYKEPIEDAILMRRELGK